MPPCRRESRKTPGSTLTLGGDEQLRAGGLATYTAVLFGFGLHQRESEEIQAGTAMPHSQTPPVSPKLYSLLDDLPHPRPMSSNEMPH